MISCFNIFHLAILEIKKKNRLLSFRRILNEINICFWKKKMSNLYRINRIRIARGSNPFRNAASTASVAGNLQPTKAIIFLRLSHTCEHSINGKSTLARWLWWRLKDDGKNDKNVIQFNEELLSRMQNTVQETGRAMLLDTYVDAGVHCLEP